MYYKSYLILETGDCDEIETNVLLGLTSLGVLSTALDANAQFKINSPQGGCVSGTHTYSVGINKDVTATDGGVVEHLSKGDSFKVLEVKQTEAYKFGQVDLKSYGGDVIVLKGSNPLTGVNPGSGYAGENGRFPDNTSNAGQLTVFFEDSKKDIVPNAAVPVTNIRDQEVHVGDIGGNLGFSQNMRELDGQSGSAKVKVLIKCGNK